MNITDITTTISPNTLRTHAVTITLELGAGQSVEQAVQAVQGLCAAPARAPGTPPGLAGGRANVPPPAAKTVPDLGAYDGRRNGMPDPTTRAEPPSVGTTWPGVEGLPASNVAKVQKNVANNYYVVTLGCGSTVKVCMTTLAELARKPSKVAEQARVARDNLYTDGEVTIAPTARQSGPGAPPPGGEVDGVPYPAPPAPTERSAEVDDTLVAAETVAQAVAYAVEAELAPPGRDEFIAWAQRVRTSVPAFELVAKKRYLDRMGRAYDQAVPA